MHSSNPTRLRDIGRARTLIVDATTRCNQKCVFCFERHLHFTRPDMTLEQVSHLARRARDEGFEVLTFIGGEITLVKWLIPAIELIKGLGLQVTLVTNGTALGSRSYTKRLLESGVDAVQISLLSHRQADDERAGGLKRGLALRRLALENVSALRATRKDTFALSAAVVVSALNAPYLSEMIGWLLPYGVDLYALKAVHITENIRAPGIVPRLRDVRSELAKAMALLEHHHLAFRFEGFPLCAVDPRHHECRQDPKQKRGFGFRYGNAGQDVKAAVALQRFPPCSAARCVECALREPCGGPQDRYLALHGEEDLRPFAAAPPR
jgi:MoaA/NifB/PqqE/SkfB family radical SAM enzyme